MVSSGFSTRPKAEFDDDEDVKKLKKIKSILRKAISDFCRWRIDHGECDRDCKDDDCCLCPISYAYDMAGEGKYVT